MNNGIGITTMELQLKALQLLGINSANVTRGSLHAMAWLLVLEGQ